MNGLRQVVEEVTAPPVLVLRDGAQRLPEETLSLAGPMVVAGDEAEEVERVCGAQRVSEFAPEG